MAGWLAGLPSQFRGPDDAISQTRINEAHGTRHHNPEILSTDRQVLLFQKNTSNVSRDEDRPTCRRCQIKGLPCSRPVKKTVFRHGSVANFSRDQKWVNSVARHFRYHTRGGGTSARAPLLPDQSRPSSSPAVSAPTGRISHAGLLDRDGAAQSSPDPAPADALPMQTDHALSSVLNAPTSERGSSRSDDFGREQPPTRRLPELSSSHVQTPPYLPSIPQSVSFSYRDGSANLPSVADGYANCSNHTNKSSSIPCADSAKGSHRVFPLENVQEACLLRYWIEKISHWFDLCDESRHFQLVVPMRAREHAHLLNAIFAVAARHLSRLPKYKTAQGIRYHGQLLPHLDEHSAVEYMLLCMPALRRFHDDFLDDDYRDSIVATAVILRQLEEIDDQDDLLQLSGIPNTIHSLEAGKQVNFLAIIDAVLRSPPSQSVFGQRSLMQAAYWMALRQEIYHSFTRLQAPQLILPPEFWHIASPANKSVMHLVQVAKWKWGSSSPTEWCLMDQQEHLENTVLADIQPLFKRSADKTRGEIFPTVWYHSNIEVTSIQFSLLAKSVLVAENPQIKLDPASRSRWRQVENDVRLLLLEQSGIALCNPASPPALVHAAFGIQVYGDFFTDPYERKAIRMVVEKYRDTHAWPVQRLLDMFR
ncbi:hypothetical protein E4U42_005803 [Claviceps africana]|uniref:ARCA protein n=1 Tax=Claviceps africana TaxID=83212 RepID=A0A8K0NH65_9HYPO|nr:hypothetical protein E4U42_005803 [Claviceps africana]